MQKILLYILICLFLHDFALGQIMKGQVQDEQGQFIPGITVKEKGTHNGAITNYEGRFSIEFTGLPTTLIFQAVGFQRYEKKIENVNSLIKIVLNESTTELNAVQILGKSQAREIKEQSFAVEVVDSKNFKNLSTNANDILGKISGVNIRQSGGLGSQFSVSLNGLSGNQLRLFMDGVPMDYFGSSLSLNNFSANLIDRIEVYKGVVPVRLSSDALGGAINVVTSKHGGSFLDGSYSVGSFNTHIASFNGQIRHQKTGFTARFKSFYNRSDNNYKVPVYLVDFETGKQEKEETWVARFHDAYQAKMSWIEAGFTNVRFADQLMIGVLYSENDKQLQQPANAVGQAKIPYGNVTNQEQKVISNFTFNKTGLLNDKASFRSYFVGVFSHNTSSDTSSYRYDWFGNKELKSNTSTGEIENRKTLLNLHLKNYLANVNGEYLFTPNHILSVNYSLNHMELEGNDPYKAQNDTQFSRPSTVNKQVIGASYTQSFFSQKLKNTFFTKLYQYHVASLETNYQGTEVTAFDESKQSIGFGVLSTLLIKKFQFKVSFENATRFPELIELFGDGLNFIPNPTLLPEQSNNYNLGVIYNSRAQNLLEISVNGFVRDAEDFILTQVQGIKAFHVNNGKVLAKGVDLSAQYHWKNALMFSLNGTYLDKRDNNQWRNGQEGVANSQYKIRVPNEPYLFGNLRVSYRKEGLIKSLDNFSVYVIQNFTHEFYYRWQNLASKDKGTVPDQWTSNLDFVYSIQEERYNFSFGIANLWDAKVYDNFQQLRPGRTFNFKVRYFIK